MNPNDTTQPRHYQNDEIDLFELVQNLWAQKWLIIGITAVATAIALVYALRATPIYETSARLAPPSQSDIAGYNFGKIIMDLSSDPDSKVSLTQYTTKGVYDIFTRNLSSQRVRNQFFEKFYLPYRGVNVDADDIESSARDQLMRQFSNTLVVEQASSDQPDNYRVRVQLDDPERAAEWANTYIEMAEAEAGQEIFDNVESELRAHADATARRLQSLRAVERQKREDRIVRLQEALRVAEALGIDDSQVAIGRTSADSSLAAYVEGDLMYLRGTQALQAELAVLEARDNDEAFIPELRKLESREGLLRTIALDRDAVAMFTLDSPAGVPETPIKPNKRLIVMFGVVMGGILGVFLALIRMAVVRHRSFKSAI